MAGTAAQRRAYEGPAILTGGFRPFFLSAGVWGAAGMALWIAALTGLVAIPGPFAPLDWHVHEFLFGYLSAAVAGFLLTAIPNWTGRLPVIGAPLALLWLLWLAGRLAVLGVGDLPHPAVAAVDVAFAAALVAVALREVVAGKVWRNLPVVGLAALFGLANALHHLDAAGARLGDVDLAGAGPRLGIGAIVTLVALIGGRITPSFTRNWLVRRDPAVPPGCLPAPFDRLDGAGVLATALAFLAWTLAPETATTGALCLGAALLLAFRLARWRGLATWPDPLVFVLHAAYAFAPLGLGLLGASILAPGAVPHVAALHALTAGAAGVMTLAVMIRASLGHTGRPLVATPAMTGLMVLAVTAALARVAAAFLPGSLALLHLSAAAWIGACGGFALVFLGALICPRR